MYQGIGKWKALVFKKFLKNNRNHWKQPIAKYSRCREWKSNPN